MIKLSFSKDSKVIMRKQNPKKLGFGFLFWFCCSWIFMSMGMGMGMAQNTTIPVKVGVLLKLETEIGKIWLSCIQMALSDFYASHASFKTRLLFKTRDSKQAVVSAAAAGTNCFLPCPFFFGSYFICNIFEFSLYVLYLSCDNESDIKIK